MGWGLAIGAGLDYLASRDSDKASIQAANAANQPQPTYYKFYQTPVEQGIWDSGMQDTIKSAFGGKAMMPTSEYFNSLDPNIVKSVAQEYETQGKSLWERILGGGTGGVPGRGGSAPLMSGAGAEVMGKYLQGSSQNIMSSLWNMGAEGRALPYQMAQAMMPYAQGNILTATSPNISEVNSPEYSALQALQEKFKALQSSFNSFNSPVATPSSFAGWSGGYDTGWENTGNFAGYGASDLGFGNMGAAGEGDYGGIW